MHRKWLFIIAALILFGIGRGVLAQDRPHDLLYAIWSDFIDTGSYDGGLLGTLQLYSMDIDTDQVTELVNEPKASQSNYQSGWSPDGRFMALLIGTEAGNASLKVIDMQTGKSSVVTDMSIQQSDYPCRSWFWWSPDSRYLAYRNGPEDAARSGLWDVQQQVTVNVPGGTGGLMNGKLWSPDGRYFVFSVEEAGMVYQRIWDAANQQVVPALNIVSWNDYVWLPGDRLADSGLESGSRIISPVDGSEQTFPVGDRLFSASPDGRYLMNIDEDTPDGTIYWLIDTQDGTSEKLAVKEPEPEVDPDAVATGPFEPPFRPVWSPDSRYMVYGIHETRLRDMTTGDDRVLVALPVDPATVAWSSTGHVLAFPRYDRQPGVWIFDLDADTFKRFNPPPGIVGPDGSLDWSPDDRFLTITSETDLELYDRSTQTLHKFEVAMYIPPYWSPDSRYLNMTASYDPDSGVPTFRVIDTNDMSVRDITPDVPAPGEPHYPQTSLLGWLGGFDPAARGCL